MKYKKNFTKKILFSLCIININFYTSASTTESVNASSYTDKFIDIQSKMKDFYGHYIEPTFTSVESLIHGIPDQFNSATSYAKEKLKIIEKKKKEFLENKYVKKTIKNIKDASSYIYKKSKEITKPIFDYVGNIMEKNIKEPMGKVLTKEGREKKKIEEEYKSMDLKLNSLSEKLKNTKVTLTEDDKQKLLKIINEMKEELIVIKTTNEIVSHSY
jgi:hypothetical protein